MIALEAARIHLEKTHSGDPRRALWTARRRDGALEPLPVDVIRSQPYPPWIAATCGLEGVTVTDAGGAVEMVPWPELITTTKDETMKIPPVEGARRWRGHPEDPERDDLVVCQECDAEYHQADGHDCDDRGDSSRWNGNVRRNIHNKPKDEN